MTGIFTKQSNAHSILTELMAAKESCNQSFSDLCDVFQRAELDIKYTASISKSDSMAHSSQSNQGEPCLSLFVANRSSFEKMGVNRDNSNWNSSYPKTQFIIESWSQICRNNNVSNEYYSPDMFVFIYDLSEFLLNSLVRNSKQKVIEYFQGCATKPAHIFVSSEPAIRVFYNSPRQRKKEEKTGNIQQHRNKIVEILSTAPGSECFEESSVIIEFSDCKTDSRSMYGLSRED